MTSKIVKKKPISPQGHRNFDLAALPATLALATWLSRRNPSAATVVLIIAAIEGTTQLATDFTPQARPRGSLRWISLRDHLRITATSGVFFGLIAATMEGLRTQDRYLILGLAASAPILAALTDAEESRG